MTKIGILNTIPEAPVKPLGLEALELYPHAKFVQSATEYSSGECLDDFSEDAVAALGPESYDRIIHDGDWTKMSRFHQEFIAQALASGAIIQIVNGRKGEK